MTETLALERKRITYDDGTVRAFVVASVGWGLIGLLVGLLAALQLSFWQLNFETPFLTFSRIRPLHTNAVIFALVGNMMFAGVYYSSQRLLKARMASDFLSKFHLWSWNLLILGAALTLPFGITQSKEYAELEWFLDILAALSWVAFGVNFLWTLKIRNERNLYVAIWFYIATIITITVLYVVNNLALPVTATKSYSLWSGAQDALTQWWYGHNAVAFFLTTPILGIMYYFLPKAAERPVYSYRLSIIHFWALVFIYIWAGPHHLLYSALPDWAQSLGMLFSLMLWAPSWGGMLNGLLTLRGAWHKVRTDPVLKFFVAAVTFYGMSTFEGPLLSIKSVNALGHGTDWIIGHVHGGALGWNGFMAAGLFYWLVPRLFGTKLYSRQLADFHFWIGTFGILMYVVAMWVAGVTHGLMWREMNPDGSLVWPSWVEIVDKVQPMYMARSLGGLMYISGWVLMIYNLVKTAKSGARVDGEVEVTVYKPRAGEPSDARIVFGKPTVMTVLGLVACYFMADSENVILGIVGVVLLLMIVAASGFMLHAAAKSRYRWHDVAESKPLAFTVLVTLAILIGGVVELVPGIVIQKEVPTTATGELAVRPYTPLQLEGRDVYVSEGCYVCHTQMVRPFYEEWRRYGHPSRIEESVWDHPFQWGSKRTGPDLARLGNYLDTNRPKYDNLWHYNHMMDPRSTSPGSVMPAYPWMKTDKVDLDDTPGKLRALQSLGVPYSAEDIAVAAADYEAEARAVVDNLALSGVEIEWDSKLVALIAYLQRLGANDLFEKVASATGGGG
ncbi:MAG: cytochrome-c oxidase, cbb3-type subunit I [Planctomycetes bacterium]|nr:cytochrome-c oxidase, cbb3-type subunit I [Planctomycetota bacterium]